MVSGENRGQWPLISHHPLHSQRGTIKQIVINAIYEVLTSGLRSAKFSVPSHRHLPFRFDKSDEHNGIDESLEN